MSKSKKKIKSDETDDERRLRLLELYKLYGGRKPLIPVGGPHVEKKEKKQSTKDILHNMENIEEEQEWFFDEEIKENE